VGYSKQKSPFKKNFLVGHGRYGSMIPQEIRLQEIQTNLENFMISDEVPEENEILN
jgi:hypothetical protein